MCLLSPNRLKRFPKSPLLHYRCDLSPLRECPDLFKSRLYLRKKSRVTLVYLRVEHTKKLNIPNGGCVQYKYLRFLKRSNNLVEENAASPVLNDEFIQVQDAEMEFSLLNFIHFQDVNK
ncbi:hypothetical protein NPIL_246951 [Nephila pilipes]|uniref:Uncharacterized protein n=1 Tax=Nephila pilipes TaxID=299642 RepID=A0A8X6P4J5_NEPPI|nr:hypothetical protein NPIL_246951 [Nephila pilipes]